jgi:glycosyltransferase involved in cell wall biosynthesis
MSTGTKPFVSVVTPTYNRTRFVPAMVGCYKAQTYPKDRMEWIILDDGTESIETLFQSLTVGLPNIRYIRLSEKINIGAKRNILNREAKGELIISMDDDDYYCPERVSYTVLKFMQNPTIQLAGCSELYMFYSNDGTILKLGPYHKNHATNGTLAVRKQYAKTHSYDESVTHAEEHSFLDEYKHPMIQLDSTKVMLVMSHSENTYDKDKFKSMDSSPFVKKINMKLKDFIKDKALREFYATA